MRDQPSIWTAVHLLAHATPHPDIFWHKSNTIAEDVATEIRESYRWSPNEIAMLLARMPEEGLWSRGTIGQSLYMILVADPSIEWSLERVMLEAFRSDEMTWRSGWVMGPPFGPKWVHEGRHIVIYACLLLSLYLASEPRTRLRELTERMPPLRNLEMFSAVAETVTEFGHIDIF
jgi:hypothetical protein